MEASLVSAERSALANCPEHPRLDSKEDTGKEVEKGGFKYKRPSDTVTVRLFPSASRVTHKDLRGVETGKEALRNPEGLGRPLLQLHPIPQSLSKNMDRVKPLNSGKECIKEAARSMAVKSSLGKISSISESLIPRDFMSDKKLSGFPIVYHM